ncbi:structural cement protein Gp24 [Alicyclobacillus sendaiensis]|uniref:structural cement protein Gp24 n=1 Tax=Alicyclobacillus sendaiensis TaxID=192387 RepID=UPI0026F4712B|nr:hypothetical protein [Alicyclobacillus sendaiensis]
MPGSVIGKTLNLGYPGNVSRSEDAVIVNRPVRPTDTNPIPFGAPVVLNADNTYSLFGASNTAADFAGVAIREVKQATSYLGAPYGITQYNPGDPCDVIERGSVTVTCQLGTPTAGGAVYIRVAANASYPNAVVGGFEAQADGTNNILIPNVVWKTGKIDGNNTAEITILNRNKP